MDRVGSFVFKMGDVTCMVVWLFVFGIGRVGPKAFVSKPGHLGN